MPPSESPDAFHGLIVEVNKYDTTADLSGKFILVLVQHFRKKAHLNQF